jgi:hypothetical protein
MRTSVASKIRITGLILSLSKDEPVDGRGVAVSSCSDAALAGDG